MVIVPCASVPRGALLLKLDLPHAEPGRRVGSAIDGTSEFSSTVRLSEEDVQDHRVMDALYGSA